MATTFLITAGMFGGLAIYGDDYEAGSRRLGQFLFMGLLGVVLASIVGLFWHSDGFQFVLSGPAFSCSPDLLSTTRSGRS